MQVTLLYHKSRREQSHCNRISYFYPSVLLKERKRVKIVKILEKVIKFVSIRMALYFHLLLVHSHHAICVPRKSFLKGCFTQMNSMMAGKKAFRGRLGDESWKGSLTSRSNKVCLIFVDLLIFQLFPLSNIFSFELNRFAMIIFGLLFFSHLLG